MKVLKVSEINIEFNSVYFGKFAQNLSLLGDNDKFRVVDIMFRLIFFFFAIGDTYKSYLLFPAALLIFCGVMSVMSDFFSLRPKRTSSVIVSLFTLGLKQTDCMVLLCLLTAFLTICLLVIKPSLATACSKLDTSCVGSACLTSSRGVDYGGVNKSCGIVAFTLCYSVFRFKTVGTIASFLEFYISSVMA